MTCSPRRWRTGFRLVVLAVLAAQAGGCGAIVKAYIASQFPPTGNNLKVRPGWKSFVRRHWREEAELYWRAAGRRPDRAVRPRYVGLSAEYQPGSDETVLWPELDHECG